MAVPRLFGTRRAIQSAMGLMPDIGSLLRQSMAAHEEAMRARYEKRSDREALLTAYALRREAHEVDPEHLDLAWHEEQHRTPGNSDTHAALMKFYKQRLGL